MHRPLMLLLASFLLIGCVGCAGSGPPAPSSAPPSARPPSITAVHVPKGAFPRFPFVAPDGTVWCSESSGESIARIDKSGSLSHVRIPGSENSPAGVVRGPDDQIWFAGFQLIGKIAADGTLSGWRTGARGPDLGLPNALTAGPDNAIWYTNERVPPTISRISTSGEFRHHAIPSTDTVMELPGITTGPDGALWFAESSTTKGAAHAIGRMTVDGNYTRWPLPGSDPAPSRIVTGPDGALWFTMARGIGRMSVDGAFAEFPLPEGTRPFDIAAGPDGALWFSTNQRSVGRATTSGEITFRPVDGAMQLIGIAAAPDGTLWIADGQADTIWHYSP